MSGSLVKPADTLLAAQSPLRHPALPPTGSLDSTFEEKTGKAIPFAIETESQDMQKDPLPVLCTAPDRNNYKFYNHPDQFAWWSRHWAALTADKRDTEKSLCTGEQDRLDMTVAGRPARYVPKPIKPVDNFWKGNFQKRPVPWRREQLGAFPTYKDFPWPPQDPSHTDALRQEEAWQKRELEDALARPRNERLALGVAWPLDMVIFRSASTRCCTCYVRVVVAPGGGKWEALGWPEASSCRHGKHPSCWFRPPGRVGAA